MTESTEASIPSTKLSDDDRLTIIRRMYVDEKKVIREIAPVVGLSAEGVRCFMVKHGIPRRNKGRRSGGEITG